MQEIAGMSATGRIVRGPASDLVEVVAQNGLKHLVVMFHPKYADHDCLNGGVQSRLGWMEQPEVGGLARCTLYVPESTAFAYATGTVWTIGEVISTLSDMGAVAGVKAGLELSYLVGEILADAAENAPRHGIPNHGGLDPWRVLLKADGQVALLGYGLCAVDVLAFRENRARVPTEDGLRYSPPERLGGVGEDATSDLFSLALIALELMIGRPVYDGLVDDIVQQVTRAEGVRRLYQWREKLPDSVRDVFGRALKPDPDTRFADPVEFVYAIHDLLNSLDAEGPSLLEVMQKVRAHQKRGKAHGSGATAMLTREDIEEMTADVGDDSGRSLPPPRRPRPDEREDAEKGEPPPRWGRVERPGRSVEEKKTAPAGDDLRSRLKRSRSRDKASAGSGADAEGASDRERSRRAEEGMRRGKRGASEANRPRRVRRSRDDAAALDASSATATAPSSTTSEAVPEPDSAPLMEASSEPEVIPDPEGAPEPNSAVDETPPSESDGEGSTESTEQHSVEAARPDAEHSPPPDTATAEKAKRRSSAAELLARLRGSMTPTATPVTAPARAVESVAVAVEEAAETGPAAADGPQELMFQVQGDGPLRKVTLSSQLSVSEAVLAVSAAPGPGRTDLTGRLVEWRVMEQSGRRVRGATRVSELDSGQPLHVVAVENRVVRVSVEVRDADDLMRFQAPVGTAIPAGMLLRHLCDWLELPVGDWYLTINGQPLGDCELLEEHNPGPAMTLVVTR